MFTYRTTTYMNGKIADMYDSVDYPTKEKALAAARYSAEYYTIVTKGCTMEKTEGGAIRWWTDEEGNRFRREYKLND